MANTVFYSWQKDAPENIGFGFIEEALKAALNEFHTDITLGKALNSDPIAALHPFTVKLYDSCGLSPPVTAVNAG